MLYIMLIMLSIRQLFAVDNLNTNKLIPQYVFYCCAQFNLYCILIRIAIIKLLIQLKLISYEVKQQYMISSRSYLNSSQNEIKSANINIKYVIN